jgi:two-component system, sensor histidine kinase PdtaS
VPSLDDLVREHTDLTESDLEWLHVLVSDWQLLADLSFADLLLWLPDRTDSYFRVGAQMRPTTGPTAYVDDLVGLVIPRGRRPLVDAAFDEGTIRREGDPEWRDGVPVRVEAIPVRREGEVIAVIGRHTNLLTARTPSRLELTYLECASDLARMIAEGSFPFPGQQAELLSSPRVGDGIIRLDRSGFVVYASPNALSAYRRLGLTADLIGTHLGRSTAKLVRPAGPTEEAVSAVASGRAPRDTDIQGEDATVQLRAIPLTPGENRIGALVLVRDVTELRGRERELVTKDTTIREIHHRVKNNLQTVAALLRLQARRLGPAEGRAALQEAVRRVGSIAIVHETLSQTLDERVDFDQIADRVVGMVADVSTAESVVRPRRVGSFGVLPPALVTPLAMALTEILQNSIEHGLGEGPGLLVVEAERHAGRLRVVIDDDGIGLPDGFDQDQSSNLGLQIVRTLVGTELGGQMEMGPRPGGGTRVVLDIPVRRSRRR